MCAGALTWSQISKVVIGARDEKRGFINQNLKLHPKTEIDSANFRKWNAKNFLKKKNFWGSVHAYYCVRKELPNL